MPLIAGVTVTGDADARCAPNGGSSASSRRRREPPMWSGRVGRRATTRSSGLTRLSATASTWIQAHTTLIAALAAAAVLAVTAATTGAHRTPPRPAPAPASLADRPVRCSPERTVPRQRSLLLSFEASSSSSAARSRGGSGGSGREQYPRLQVEAGVRLVAGWGEVEGPAPEPADGGGDVGGDSGQIVGVDGLAVGGNVIGSVGDVAGGGVHDAVGEQLVELDHFLLVVRVVV